MLEVVWPFRDWPCPTGPAQVPTCRPLGTMWRLPPGATPWSPQEVRAAAGLLWSPLPHSASCARCFARVLSAPDSCPAGRCCYFPKRRGGRGPRPVVCAVLPPASCGRPPVHSPWPLSPVRDSVSELGHHKPCQHPHANRMTGTGESLTFKTASTVTCDEVRQAHACCGREVQTTGKEPGCDTGHWCIPLTAPQHTAVTHSHERRHSHFSHLPS